MKHHYAYIALALLLLASPLASAATYSLVDERYLPVQNINDPISHRNRPITQYSYEELDAFMQSSANFLRWNDGRKVCEAMYIMFGKVSDRCERLPPPKTFVRVRDTYVMPTIAPAKTEAKVTFTIEPIRYHSARPQASMPRAGQPLIIVQPLGVQYGPWMWN